MSINKRVDLLVIHSEPEGLKTGRRDAVAAEKDRIQLVCRTSSTYIVTLLFMFNFVLVLIFVFISVCELVTNPKMGRIVTSGKSVVFCTVGALPIIVTLK